METVNVLTFSGGKDSTAMWLYAIEQGVEVMPVFNDTGHEHQLTYEYVEYLDKRLGSVKQIKADFTKQIENKREYISAHWPSKLMQDVPGFWLAEGGREKTDIPEFEPSNVHQEGIKAAEWLWIPPQKGLSARESAEVVERALSVLQQEIRSWICACGKGDFQVQKGDFVQSS